MKTIDIANLRLAAQHIATADFERAEDVVRHMGAMQAQDYAGTKWAIGLRMKHATETGIEQAVKDRKILRTWPQRGTIHFVVPEEVRWRLQLSTPRILAGAKRRHENLGLTAKDFTKALNLFQKVLQGDKQLSRPNMMKTLEAGGIATTGQRGYHILWYLAQTGHLCFGPLEGKQPTFALLDDWVPNVPEISREEALQRLTKQYFTSHGPATTQDLAWWSGLTMTEVKQGLEAAKTDVESIVVSHTTYYLGRGLEPAKSPSAFLLPGFDEYMLGYKDRSAALALEHSQKVVPGGNGMFLATVVIDGQIVGTWKRIVKKSGVAINHTPFEIGRELQKSLVAAESQYKAYLAG